MRFRLSSPLASNPRMEDPLKRASLGRVAKDYCSKFLSIQVAATGKNGAPKPDPNFLSHPGKLDERMSGLIGVEKSHAWQNFTEVFAEHALTRGNSAGNPNRRHKKLSAVKAAVSATKSPTLADAAPNLALIVW